MKIITKDIIGYKGLYTINTLGQIWSIKNKKYLKHNNNNTGIIYPSIALYKNGKNKGFLIHRLIAEHFIPNPENKPQVNHINQNKKNFSISNLEWVTRSENILKTYENVLRKNHRGEKRSTLKNKDVLEIFYAIGKQYKIAKHFNIAGISVRKIKNGKRWKHLLEKTGDIRFTNDFGYLNFEGKNIKFRLLKETDLKNNKKEKVDDSTFLKNKKIMKIIPSHPNYMADCNGDIYNIVEKRYIAQHKNKNGYIAIKIGRVHRLIAETFIPNPENKPFVNHINNIKDDNRVENLEWVTPKENAKKAAETGARICPNGEKNGNTKLTEKDVLEIFYMNSLYKDIAKKYSVKIEVIGRIKNKKSWKHLTENL